MAKEKVDLRYTLNEFKEKFDLIQKIPCTKEENKHYAAMQKSGQALPQGVYVYEYTSVDDYAEYYTVYIPDLTSDEIQEYLTFKKLSILNTIKNCVLFFTILTIIGLVGTLLLLC